MSTLFLTTWSRRSPCHSSRPSSRGPRCPRSFSLSCAPCLAPWHGVPGLLSPWERRTSNLLSTRSSRTGLSTRIPNSVTSRAATRLSLNILLWWAVGERRSSAQAMTTD
eukprot:XP_001705739.1 Hypothetical protein GL50803_18464 [Giardia lamblia ATCC 50803]